MTKKIYTDAMLIDLAKPPRHIWLASWYPSRTSPYNGDFIQRHAAAVARQIPLLVIHTIHDPALGKPVQYEVTKEKGLTEIMIYFQHQGTTRTILEKISYNLVFYRYTKHLLSTLILKYGLPNLLHVHVPVKMGRIALWAKRKWALPFMVSEQSSAYLPSAPDAYQHRSLLYRRSVKTIFSNAIAVTNVSDTVGKILRELFQIKHIQVIRNLADPARFHFAGTQDKNKFRFIHVSTLKYQKNVRGILDVMLQVSKGRDDVELVLVGGENGIGEEWPSELHNAPWLKIVGMVEHDHVARHMQKAHCLVLFSRDENFPCVIVEALCCGLPVITSDAGGCGEAISPRNGIVVASEDEPALLAAMNKMIAHYDHYDGNAISASAIKEYGVDKVGTDFINLYRETGLL